MNVKRTLTRFFVETTDGWNHELHQAIEDKVQAEFRRAFPNGTDDFDVRIPKMREFYFLRMSVTANLLVACAALLISLVALIVAVVGLKL